MTILYHICVEKREDFNHFINNSQILLWHLFLASNTWFFKYNPFKGFTLRKDAQEIET